MPPRRQQSGNYRFPTGDGSIDVLDVTGVPTGRPPIGGPYIRRNRLTGRYYAFHLASWYEFGGDSTMGLRPGQVGVGSGSQFAVPAMPSAPIPGNIMVLFATARNGSFPTTPAGWTLVASQFAGSGSGGGFAKLWYRIAQVGDAASVTVDAAAGNFPVAILAEFTGVTGVVSGASVTVQPASASPTFAYSPSGSGPWLEVSAFTGGADGAGNSGPTAPGAGWTNVANIHPGGADAFGPYAILNYAIRGVALAPLISAPNQIWGGAVISLV
jgi:hypothetical protein